MNYKQAQAVLSDFLRKCEDEGIALPADPISAVAMALKALSREAKHEVGQPQMEAALAQMRAKCGVVKQASESPTPRRRATAVEGSDDKQGKKHRSLKDEVLAKSAKCNENQSLVEQLVQLGEFELNSCHTQRGVARLRAAKALRDADDVITSGAEARKLDRVGPSAAAKIDAILHGGLEQAVDEYGAP